MKYLLTTKLTLKILFSLITGCTLFITQGISYLSGISFSSKGDTQFTTAQPTADVSLQTSLVAALLSPTVAAPEVTVQQLPSYSFNTRAVIAEGPCVSKRFFMVFPAISTHERT